MIKWWAKQNGLCNLILILYKYDESLPAKAFLNVTHWWNLGQRLLKCNENENSKISSVAHSDQTELVSWLPVLSPKDHNLAL